MNFSVARISPKEPSWIARIFVRGTKGSAAWGQRDDSVVDFSAFELWKPVLKTPGVTFVNLQYGDAADDIAFAKSKFGVDVHTLDGIDLKNDLDQVTALAKACDIVIGPTNATTSLGAAAGGNIWYIHPHARIWSHMGAGRSPWFPSARSFFGKGYADWIGILKQVAKALAEEVEAAKNN